MLIGIFRYELWIDHDVDTLLEHTTHQHAQFEATVVDEPDVREGKTHLTVSLMKLRSASSSQIVNGTAEITVNRYPEYHYGDTLLIDGKLKKPEVFIEPDGRVFNYPAYLLSKGITYQLLFPNVTLLGVNHGNVVMSTLFIVKSRFEEAIKTAVPSPQDALLSGLLLGGKQSLGKEWLERFQITGIVHIVVLSGYNMTIVAEWLVVLFRSFGFYASLSVASIGIILFALMTGGGATVMRAAIMALIVLLAKATGRNYDMGRALLVAGALMVLQNPSILRDDPSFQLSFLASIGLIYASPVFEAYVSLFKRIPFLREILISTLATQLVVLPLLLYQTGMFSLISLPANMLVLPLIPLTMLFGFIAGVVSLMVPSIGFLVGLPAYALLSWVLTVARYGADIPHATLHAGNIPSGVVVVLYLIIALVIKYHYMLARIISRLSQARGVPPLN